MGILAHVAAARHDVTVSLTTARLALVISLLVALWNLWQFRLNGARVRVTLSAGLLEEYSIGWAPTWKALERATEGKGGWPVEVAVVDVENSGRTAVTITTVHLDFGRPTWWRRGRHKVSPRPLQAPQAETETRKRLEPNDDARYVFDVWEALVPTRLSSRLPGDKRVRASVKIAGRRRAKRSSWHRGWSVHAGQHWFLASGAEIGLATFRAMWRHGRDDMMTRIGSIPVALEIRERFPADGPSPTEGEVRQVIENHFHGPGEDRPLLGLTAFYVAQELEPFFAGHGAAATSDITAAPEPS